MTRFRTAATVRGFREESWASVAGVELSAFTKRSPGVRPRIYVSAGIHGDEPAPPEALLQLLETGAFDGSAHWFLVPLINPTGFQAQTRENAASVDLNRDYRHLASAEVQGHVAWLSRQPRFDLALCLHEDWESTGFYFYELNATNRPSSASGLRQAGAGVCPIDPATVIDGRPIDEPGIIRPESDPALRETWPEAIYLRHHHTALCYTIESPSTFPLAQRCATHAAIVRQAIADTCRLALDRR